MAGTMEVIAVVAGPPSFTSAWVNRNPATITQNTACRTGWWNRTADPTAAALLGGTNHQSGRSSGAQSSAMTGVASSAPTPRRRTGPL